MAQRLTTSFVNTVTPGAYPNVNVRSTPVGFGATGIIAIIGEASGGADFAEDNLRNNFFSPDQLSQVKDKYVSGPIVDAFSALTSPANDPNIQGSVNQVYILKTNGGAKAEAILDTDYAVLRAKNQGIDGNKIKYQITASQLEVAPTISGTTIPAFGAALDGNVFNIRLNGGASVAVTLSGTASNHNNIANLIIELNALLPVGIVASAGTAADSLRLTVAADAANYRKGWGKTVQLIDSTPGDLANLGLPAGLIKSSAESEVELSVIRPDIGLSEILEAKGQIALEVGYNGTTASLSIVNNLLTTTVVGGSGANLSVNVADFATTKDLADFLSAQAGYSASCPAASNQLSPKDLDKVTAIGIAATGANIKAGRIKRSLKNFKDAALSSSAVELVATDVDGLPTPMAAAAFLTGGLKGATSAADIVDALIKLEGVAVNFVVPLFSRDAAEDIADGLTDSGSAYSIDAVHAAVRSHTLKMSTPKLKRHRVAVLSFKGSFDDATLKAQTLASFRAAMTFQDVDQVDGNGQIQTFQPWYGAVLAAGMQAAGFYKGITNKFVNAISYRDPAGFDSGSPGDVETALLAGLLILQSDTAGIKWVSDQTTYGFDSNFVYNSLQAVYAADLVTLDLADSYQRQFVGQSLADVNAAVGLSYLATKMDGYRRIKLITASDDAPLAYKNAKVTINGPVMEVSVEIKLSTTVYFIPINIDISQVQQSASA
jgi:hypothetical protein